MKSFFVTSFILLCIAMVLSTQYKESFQDLHKSQIADKTHPPNVYTTHNMEYSPETVMAEVGHLRNDLHLYQVQLPDTVASTIENMPFPNIALPSNCDM